MTFQESFLSQDFPGFSMTVGTLLLVLYFMKLHTIWWLQVQYQTLHPKLFHMTCVAHLLHNCAMKIKSYFKDVDQLIAIANSTTVKTKPDKKNLLLIYAYELMLCLHVFRQTGPPRRVDCLAPPSVCHIKTEASR